MSWRNSLLSCQFNKNSTHIYQFGVFSGDSMIVLAEVFRRKGIVPAHMFGLDSFEGMPADYVEPLWQDCWREKEFSSKELFCQESSKKAAEFCNNKVAEHLNEQTSLDMIVGFYDDVLTSDLVKSYNMKPAIYVDFDCDLYSSTLTALHFMFDNKLVDVGTVVGFDDAGGSPGWKLKLDGQTRAWRECQKKYNIKSRLLFQIGSVHPHVHQAYVIESIG